MATFRLIQLHPPREDPSYSLRGKSIRIGRSQDCDLVITDESISRHHARLTRERAGAYLLEDLGSVHGTCVNGERLQTRQLLVPGDKISLAEGKACLRFERVEAGISLDRRHHLIAAAVVAALLVAALFWWSQPSEPPALRRAQKIVIQARQSHAREDWLSTRRELRSAAGVIYQSGLLDPDTANQPVQAALQLLDPDESLGLKTLLETANTALARQRPPETSPLDRPVRCRLDQVDAGAMKRCLRKEVNFVLAELGEPTTTVPDPWLPHIGNQLASRHDFFAAILRQPNQVIPLLKQELEAAGVSPLFHYLAFIESAYRSRAQSHAGASGIWQFIPTTARRYELEVSEKLDERRDPRLATHAAAHYLRDLRDHFEDFEGSLLLAIAGYNYGEHKVDRALKKLDNPFGASPYWELVDRGLLPKETADYAPRFLAAAVAGESGLPRAEVLRDAGYAN